MGTGSEVNGQGLRVAGRTSAGAQVQIATIMKTVLKQAWLTQHTQQALVLIIISNINHSVVVIMFVITIIVIIIIIINFLYTI